MFFIAIKNVNFSVYFKWNVIIFFLFKNCIKTFKICKNLWNSKKIIEKYAWWKPCSANFNVKSIMNLFKKNLGKELWMIWYAKLIQNCDSLHINKYNFTTEMMNYVDTAVPM